MSFQYQRTSLFVSPNYVSFMCTTFHLLFCIWHSFYPLHLHCFVRFGQKSLLSITFVSAVVMFDSAGCLRKCVFPCLLVPLSVTRRFTLRFTSQLQKYLSFECGSWTHSCGFQKLVDAAFCVLQWNYWCKRYRKESKDIRNFLKELVLCFIVSVLIFAINK